MSREIPKHLIETTWRQYEFHMVGSNVEPSKLDYISGFAAAIGVITGSMDLGIPPETNPTALLMQLRLEMGQYRQELAEMENQARDRTLRLNKTMQ